MVKILSESKFICEICHRIYPSVDLAKACQQGHDLVYVPLQREDLKRLIAFLHTGEARLLTKTLFETLERYALLSVEPEPRRTNYVPQFEDEPGKE